MSFVIYNKETTIILQLRKPYYGSQVFATPQAAKGAMTRAVRDGIIPADERNEYTIADSIIFHANIEKQREVVNLMSGKVFSESVNTPYYLSPSSESYWSA